MTRSSELGGALTPCLNPTMVFPHRPRMALRSQTYRMLIRVLSHCDALQASIHPRALGEEGFLELDSALIKESLVLGEAKGSDASKEASLLDYGGISKLGNEKQMALDGATHVEKLSTLSPGREHNVYNGGSGNVVSESVNTSTSMEVLADVVTSVGIDDEKSPISVVNFSEGMEHDLQLKQREVEELIFSPQNMDLFVADNRVEEGEISGGDWVDDRAIDLFFGDSVSLEGKHSDDLLVSEENGRKLENGDDRDGQEGKFKIKRSPLVDEVEGGNGVKNLEKSTREEPNAGVKSFRDNASSNYVDLDDGRAAEQVSGAKELLHSVISAENLAQRRQITYEDIIGNKGSATAPMEVGDEKKKKRGPLTKPRKAKRKRKDRIKRAEKNKQLGVKRLKLEPVVKPKKVVYCRHYLVGRCQEGEKCKFSHDTTPLTKSTPCSFLARHSCMKGNDCPFDHELSKYPCNNFVSEGFCNRGADCLFKHEGSSIKDPSLISQLSKPESKSLLPAGGSNSKNQVNKEGMANHHIPTKLSSLNHSTGKFSENQVSKNPERTSADVPKGINFISEVRSPITNTSKHKEAAPNLKLSGGVKSSTGMVSNQLDNIQNSNETVKKEPLRPPKGINFLSFGKSPLGISATEKGTSGQVGFSAESVSGVKADSQIGSGLSSFINKMANEALPMPTHTPPGIKFVAGGRVAVDNDSAARQSRTGSDSVSSGVGLVSSISTLNNSSALGSHTPSPSLNHCSGNGAGGSSSSKTPVIFNTPTSVQRALQSTLAFAAEIDSGLKLNIPAANPFDVSRQDSSTSTFKG